MRGFWSLAAKERDHAVSDGEQHDRDPADRPELKDPPDHRRGRERRLVGVLHREVLRDRFEGDEDDDDFAGRRDEHARRAKEMPASTPTIVAETSWQMSTSNNSGLRKFSGASVRPTSAFDPRRPCSRSDLARDLFMRVSDVSAIAKKPESSNNTTTETTR